jgi:hypothetical protein
MCALILETNRDPKSWATHPGLARVADGGRHAVRNSFRLSAYTPRHLKGLSSGSFAQ